jgi:hypothetical protein
VLTIFTQPEDLTATTTRQTVPLPPSFVPEEPRKISQEERAFNAYKTLRNNRAESRFEGARKIRAAKASHDLYWLSLSSLTFYHDFTEGRRGGSEEKITLYLLLAASLCHLHVCVIPVPTQYMAICTFATSHVDVHGVLS